jgi:3-oxoadipate enol-lactonase
MPFAELTDVRIHYTISGPESAPVLVFSNSLGTNFSMWDSQLSPLASRFRLLRYDTRGHGQSSIPPGPYTIETLAGDVVRLLDSLQLERVHFCGLSLGGQTGIWLGLHAPERLHRLVLANTAAKIGVHDAWNARINTVLTGGMKEVAQAVIARWFTPGFFAAHPEIVAPTLKVLESTNPQGYANCCAAVRDFDARTELASIKTPTLAITGAHDPATPPADGRFLAEKIPGARSVELEAAHLSNIEAAARFNEEVAAFLSA